MESLADLLKAMPNGRSMLRDFEQIRRELFADPLIVKLRQKYPELDEETMKLHVNQLSQYVAEYNHCSNCPGLDRCPNDYEGHYTRLTVQDRGGRLYIHDTKVACKKQVARQTREAVQSRIRSFYVDERVLQEGYALSEIVDRDAQRIHAVSQIVDYIERVESQGLPQTGLYLHGGFGTGKTFLMCYMLHELAKMGVSGVIVYVPDFVEDLKLMFDQPQRMKETIDLLKETDVLVFDDIGAENLNPWVRDHVMGAILNYRMNRRPTCYTSNYELGELEKHMSFTSKDGEDESKGRRIMERIRPYVEAVAVQGKNQRGG